MKASFWKRGLLGLALLTACTQPDPKLLKTEPLTTPDSTVQTTVGQTFQLVLPTLGATPAYKWVLDGDYDTRLVKLVSEADATNEFPVRPPPGYAPNRLFTLQALALGRTRLTFSQQPLTSGTTAIDEKRSFPVEIVGELNP